MTRSGGPEVLRVTEVPDPEPGPGELRLEVAEALPLERAADAHRLVATGHVRGKVVLTA
ncbi:zinc-binding dehydrogenase [Kitasatospora sp. NPDC087861]|uniref:zinc-binding dehydrogenase n=1 Tax=Kitasatospora sp. NPDC087861 TaxID=3364070 RepID=UPI00380C4A71